MQNTPPSPPGLSRADGVGSSDVATILGYNPYQSPWQAWAQKRGIVPEFDGNRFTEWGHRLEPVIAAAWSEETGVPVAKPDPACVQHQDHPHLWATPDRYYLADGGERCLLEIKTAGHAGAWGDAGTDDVPVPYLIQWQWQAQLCRVARGEIAVLIGGNDLRRYEMTARPKLGAELVRRVVAWWDRHMVHGEEPDVDGSRSASDALTARWSGTSGNIRNVGASADELIDALREATDRFWRADELKRLRENQVRRLIGDDDGIEGPGYRITWKIDKRGRRVLRSQFNSR